MLDAPVMLTVAAAANRIAVDRSAVAVVTVTDAAPVGRISVLRTEAVVRATVDVPANAAP
jgi:hypothetical protein